MLFDTFRRQIKKEATLRDIEFVKRNSLLTDLFEFDQFVRIMYYLFSMTFVFFFLWIAVYDIIESGQ